MCAVCATLIGAGLETGSALARADIAASDLQSFTKGKSTFAEVVAKLGQPSKSETNAERLRAVVYATDASKVADGAIFAFFGAANGVFTPGAPPTALPVTGAATAFVFDRRGRLMYYRAADGDAKPVTSEDGAAPMPNVKITLTADQKQTKLPPDDGKPHLGVQLVPVADLDADHKKQFGAARFDGLVVANVIPGSPGEKAGIADGDYLYTLNGMLVASFADAAKAMDGVKTGDTVVVHAKRIDEAAHLARETVFELKF